MKISKRVPEMNDAEYKFARQMGVRHIIGYVPPEADRPFWDFQYLLQLRKQVEAYGLELAAIGRPPRAALREVIHAGPRRDEDLENICTSIRNMGLAGIPVLGYNFSVYPNWGLWRAGLNGGARGDAGVHSFDYDLVKGAPVGEAGLVSADEMWQRLAYFLERVVPVAEEAGVKLACHPDDPPVAELRGAARILSSIDGLKRLVDLVPSPSNGLTFCQGTLAEMGADLFEAIRYFGERKKIFVVHFRNVHRFPGNSVKYDETFIDDGDVDMFSTLQAYAQVGYDGLLDPDHAPVVVGDSQWGRHRGYAYAFGYIAAMKRFVDTK